MPIQDTGTPKQDWSDWIGRTRQQADVISADRVAAMHATLDLDDDPPAEGAPLPPLWHWLYFWEPAKARDLGRDGHPRLGGFLPPVALDRRMWAGSRLTFHAPIPVGGLVSRTTTIASIKEKVGRSGRLAFVTLHHAYRLYGEQVLEEEHDIVYREAARLDAPQPPGDPDESAADFEEVVEPDPVLLFRFSALTLNGHRIHYDAPYARSVEGYPGLVVHGPLLATLMARAAVREFPGRPLTNFQFRGRRPVIVDQPFRVRGQVTGDSSATVWISDADGCIASTGEALFGQNGSEA